MAPVSTGPFSNSKKTSDSEDHPLNSEVIKMPIYGVSDDDDSANASSSPGSYKAPIPNGHEYDLMD